MLRFTTLVALTALPLSTPALAQDDGAENPPATTSENKTAEEKEKWCKDGYEGEEPWGCKRSISPSVGVSAIGELTNGRKEAELVYNLGGSASIFNWQRDGTFSTKIVLHGKYMLQGDGRGYDVGIAGYIGKRWKWGGGVGIGAELWRNYYNLNVTKLEATTGIHLPVFLELGPEFFHLIGGFSPSIVFNPDRRVDWDNDFWVRGFGHELSWYAGVETQIRLFTVGVAYERHWLAGGVVFQGVTLGVGF